MGKIVVVRFFFCRVYKKSGSRFKNNLLLSSYFHEIWLRSAGYIWHVFVII